MKESLMLKTNIMLKNYLALAKAFPWEMNLSQHFVALIYAQKEGKEVDVERIKEMSRFIKEETGGFSEYRGNNKFMLAALLVHQYMEPIEQFEQMQKNDEYLKLAGFKYSSYLPIANYALLITSDEVILQEDVKERAKKAYDIYLAMKKNHPWLTSGDDYPLAVLLSKFNNPIEKVEAYYMKLHEKGFYKGGSLQLLSHILSFSDEPVEDVVNRCIRLQTTLKENKLNVQASFYSAFGLISLIKDDTGEITNDVIKVSERLNHLKKFKWLGKGMNVLLAAALVSEEWIQNNKNENNQNEIIQTAMGVSIETLIAAQIAATIAAISATTAAVTAAT